MEGTKLPAVLAALSPEELAKVPQVLGTTELGEGHEQVDGVQEITMPRAKVVQFTSNEAQAQDQAERIQPGLFINSLTKAEVGKVFMPIFKFTNFIKWNPRKSSDAGFDPNYGPGEMVFQTVDVKDPRVQEGINFGPDGEPPLVTRYMNFLVYIEGNRLPMILPFAKTSMRGGENLNTLLMSNGGNVWNFKYQIVVNQKEGDAGKYFALDVKPAGLSTPEEKIIGKLWFDMFYKKNIKVDPINEEHPDAGFKD